MQLTPNTPVATQSLAQHHQYIHGLL